MLVPDNIHPEQTIYFNGSVVLQVLQSKSVVNMLDLYILVKDRLEMTAPVFLLCLDWLFLLDIITLNENGKVELCS